LFVDRIKQVLDVSKEPFQLVEVDGIGIPDLDWMAFRYTTLEFATAVKPFFLRYLLGQLGFERIVYLDPDILVFDDFTHIFELLKEHPIILTPHLLEPINDNLKPSELEILQAGVFNLGFIAVAKTPTTTAFLNWWSSRLKHGCLMEHSKSMHVDQRWVDLVPALFRDTYILTDPSWNVAYWNLHGRRVTSEGGKLLVNGSPLHFFHFSGFDADNPEVVSIHQNRWTMSNLNKTTAELFHGYANELLTNGWSEFKQSVSAFEYFNDGHRIPEPARKFFRELEDSGKTFSVSPFETSKGSFLEWLKQPVHDQGADFQVSRFWYHIWKNRPDLQVAYPDPLEKDRAGFLTWIRNSGERETGADEAFLPPDQKSASEPIYGVNLTGYLSAVFGLAESAKQFAYALQAGGIPFVLNDFQSGGHARRDKSMVDYFSGDNPFAVNIIHVNADETQRFLNSTPPRYFRNRVNVGIWYWELSDFPDKWIRCFDPYDEIWVASEFVRETLSRVSPKPVEKFTHPLKMDVPISKDPRSRFGLNEHTCVFLFAFDYHSVFERKNPLAVVEAFNRAFKPNDDALLIIKTINSDGYEANARRLREAARGSRIQIFDGHFTKSDMVSLLASSSCFVSLHRSEGLGVMLAQTMYLGKPVIATGYSGNLEFMNDKNSLLVRYELAKLEQDFGPYTKGNVWAEPDIEHAAELMRYVYEHPVEAAELGKRASLDVDRLMNPEVVGQQLRAKLDRLTESHSITGKTN